MNSKDHWENIYQSKPLTDASWYELIPETSLSIISRLKLPKDAAIIDIGGGDSLLADHLLALGYTNITVLDISSAAIERAKLRMGKQATLVNWVVSDMLVFKESKKFEIWHDRAAFHFLTDPQDQQLYLDIVNRNLKEKGYLIVSTFALDGPEKCSNLPVQQFSEISLCNKFGPYFKKLNCFTKEHLTPFRTLQQFLHCTFQKIQ